MADGHLYNVNIFGRISKFQGFNYEGDCLISVILEIKFNQEKNRNIRKGLWLKAGKESSTKRKIRRKKVNFIGV